MKHEHDARIKQSTCPGCGTHLPSKGGLNSARYTISKEDSSTLHGLQPDSVLHLAGSAIHFWVSQERTHAEYLRHLYESARKSKEDQKESFKQLHAEMTQEIATARAEKDQAEARNDEFKQEMHLIEEKYQEETRKVRMLQERMVDMKRGKRGESPMRPSTPEHSACSPTHPSSLRQRVASPVHTLQQPAHRSALSMTTAPRGLGRLSSPAPHRPSFEAPRLGRVGLGSSIGGIGGSSGSISRLGNSSYQPFSAPNSRQPTPVRQSTFGHGSLGALSGRR